MAKPPPDGTQWYFAYGSNMCTAVLTGKRGINPLKSEVVSLPNYALRFNVLFIPYLDPAMAGLAKRNASEKAVFGVAHLLTHADLLRVIITEGAGVAYSILEAEAMSLDGRKLQVVTLVARYESHFSPFRYPSQRYMGLLVEGARESGLPVDYQKYLASGTTFKPLSSRRWRIGRWLFQAVWHRISVLVQKGTKRFKDDDGNVPAWFLGIFDLLLWLMWFHHDYIQAPLFGRGDGRIS